MSPSNEVTVKLNPKMFDCRHKYFEEIINWRGEINIGSTFYD